MEILKQCGHRLAARHFKKIRDFKRKRKSTSEGHALRTIIDEAVV